MTKKIIFIVIILSGIYCLYYQINKYVQTANRYQYLYALETQKIDSMKKTIFVKDSMFLIKSQKLNKIKQENDIVKKEFNKIMHKYNMLENTYIKIKAQRDSIINLSFNVDKDSVIDNKYNFSTNFDVFSITGSYGCHPQFIKAVLKQQKPIILNIGIYQKNDKYMAIVKSNSKLLQFDWAYVNFANKQKTFWDKAEITFGIPLNHFGFTGGFFYNNYGIQYIKLIDDYNLTIGYKASLRNLWEMIR